MQKIQIDIVSDVVCPWCYVGKKHLENAIETLGESYNFEINWHPFQLDPTIPQEGLERNEYMVKKFGDLERIEQIHNHLVNIAQKAGINFNFDKIKTVINTLGLHKLLNVAQKEGIQHDMEDRFFRAYFVDGVDFTQESELFKLMAEFGWSAEKVKQILANDAIGYEVRQEINHFQRLGVTGVPFFILNNKYALSGAQPSSVFVEALQKVSEEMGMVEAVGETCSIDGSNC